MKLSDLGYNPDVELHRKESNFAEFDVARVISELKERYLVVSEKGEFEAEIIGNLRFSAKNRFDFPAVGDWVAIDVYDKDKALIHAIYPRKTVLKRQAVGKFAEDQIIATNIDCTFIIQAADRDFNPNRIERYLTLCNDSNIDSIIVLTKTDLIEKKILNECVETLQKRIKDKPVVSISNLNKDGYNTLIPLIEKGKTYCLLGSSGVGKSTLTNNLAGYSKMETGQISFSTSKGKHTTSHRELILLDQGGILIDNPGMREVGVGSSEEGLSLTFDEIYQLAKECKFNNCSHINENGCAIIQAVDEGTIQRDVYDNFLKLLREQEHFSSNMAEKRRKDKEFGKMVKNVKKLKKNTGKY